MLCDLATADAFLLKMLHTAPWDESNDADRTVALDNAEVLITALNVPEWTSVTVPDDVCKAISLIANKLLDGSDPDDNNDLLGVKSINFDRHKIQYRDKTLPHQAVGIPSALAYHLLIPYLITLTSVNLQRV